MGRGADPEDRRRAGLGSRARNRAQEHQAIRIQAELLEALEAQKQAIQGPQDCS